MYLTNPKTADGILSCRWCLNLDETRQMTNWSARFEKYSLYVCSNFRFSFTVTLFWALLNNATAPGVTRDAESWLFIKHNE